MINLISSDNYNNYNIVLAHILDLKTAIYLSCLCNYADKNGRINNVDTEEITYKTTFTESQQDKLKDKLINTYQILICKDDNDYIIDEEKLFSFMQTNKKIKKLGLATNKVKKRTKQDVIKDNLKCSVKTTNSELRDAYGSWIDAVIDRQGWMSKKSVELGEELIDSFSNRNLDVAISVLNLASINGYRDINWAIDAYKKQQKISNPIHVSKVSKPNIISKEIKLSQEIF